MSKNAGRIIFCVVISIVLSAILLILPGLFMKTAPTAEKVLISKKEYQDIVSVDGNIIREYRTDTINVQMFVSERDISKVKIGQIAEVRGDAFPDKIYTAEITSIYPTATKVTAGSVTKTVVEVWAEITGADESLKSGFTAQVTIKVGDTEEKRLLPYEAVDQDENGEFVWVSDNGKAAKRYIVTGEELPDGVEIVAGLSDNDEIIKIPDGVSEGDEIETTGKNDSQNGANSVGTKGESAIVS
jgi:multidrug efflux pump subunit AcrA (membrane-fusion protein)